MTYSSVQVVTLTNIPSCLQLAIRTQSWHTIYTVGVVNSVHAITDRNWPHHFLLICYQIWNHPSSTGYTPMDLHWTASQVGPTIDLFGNIFEVSYIQQSHDLNDTLFNKE